MKDASAGIVRIIAAEEGGLEAGIQSIHSRDYDFNENFYRIANIIISKHDSFTTLNSVMQDKYFPMWLDELIKPAEVIFAQQKAKIRDQPV